MVLTNQINILKDNVPVEYNNCNLSQQELYKIYYLLNTNKIDDPYVILLTYFTNALSFLNRLIIDNINTFKSQNDHFFYLYCYLNNVDIKSIINHYLLSNDFIEIDPITIKPNNFKQYYRNALLYSMRLFFKCNIGRGSSEPMQTKRDIIVSSRYNIYKKGLRLAQINAICDQSDRLRQIYNNIKYIRKELTVNELQKLYSIIVQNDETDDIKLLILKFNMNNDNLTDIKLRLPMVFRLLKSVRIKSVTSDFSYYDKSIIRDVLKEHISNKLNIFLNPIHSMIISEAIAIKIESTITDGEFIDPYTLLPVSIKGSLFLEQLVEYVQLILDHIDLTDTENSSSFGWAFSNGSSFKSSVEYTESVC